MTLGDHSSIESIEVGVGDEMVVTHSRTAMSCEKCLSVSERIMIYCGPQQRISTGIDPWGAVLTDDEIDKLEEDVQAKFCAGNPDEHFHLACPVCHYRWIEDLEDAHITH